MRYISFAFLLLAINVWSQSNNLQYQQLDVYFKNLKELEFSKALSYLDSLDSDYTEKLEALTKLISYNNQISKTEILSQINSQNLTIDNVTDEFETSLTYLLIGYYNLADISSRPKVFSNFNLAYTNALKTNYNPLIKEVLLAIIKLYRLGNIHNDDSFIHYLDAYKNICKDTIDHFYYQSHHFNLMSQTQIYGNSNQEKEVVFKSAIQKLDSLVKQIPSRNKVRIFYFYDKGNQTIKSNPDLANTYFQKAMELCDTTLFYKPIKFDCYLQIARANSKNEDYSKALKYVDSANRYKNSNDSIKSDFIINMYKSEFHGQLKNFDSAYYFMRTSRYLEYELDFQSQNAQISKLEVELGTAEKEKQLLIEQEQKAKNRNIAIALAGLVLFSSITFLLIQKNTKRKQLLAIQEKELQSQKLATVLKEQELTAIDAMIEGQEKERQRIANDLHDDLGGLMTTMKWHFDALKEKQTPELYSKTTHLLDEAYNKVRSIAHVKNSGVLAKKGLLKAINDIAKTNSVNNVLTIEVIDHGLDERLENSLELTIFRIVQELVANIIKHSKATEATIHITNHEDRLNIMVEDNGKGFNIKNIGESSGMGIHSIEKRIENLGGSVTIESEINKGTTIIIDIPT